MRGATKFILMLFAVLAIPLSALAAEHKDTAPDPQVPVASRIHVKDAPDPVPMGNALARARCFKSSVDFDEFQLCFVVKYNYLTYWPLAFDDNRVATLLAGFDENKHLITKVYVCNVRYIWYMAVDRTNKTVTLWGQGLSADPEKAVSQTIPWSLLQSGGETCIPR